MSVQKGDTVWLVGRMVVYGEGWTLAIVSVQPTETLAAAECSTERDFIVPIEVGFVAPPGGGAMPDVRYPLRSARLRKA